jgi:predicted DNA-binding protein
MRLSVRVPDEQKTVVTEYAAAHGISVSEAMRIAILEMIENDHDIALAEKALAEWEKDGKKTYTHEEIGKELKFI